MKSKHNVEDEYSKILGSLDNSVPKFFTSKSSPNTFTVYTIAT